MVPLVVFGVQSMTRVPLASAFATVEMLFEVEMTSLYSRFEDDVSKSVAAPQATLVEFVVVEPKTSPEPNDGDPVTGVGVGAIDGVVSSVFPSPGKQPVVAHIEAIKTHESR